MAYHIVYQFENYMPMALWYRCGIFCLSPTPSPSVSSLSAQVARGGTGARLGHGDMLGV